MQIIGTTVMEDCLKGTLTLLYQFDTPWTKTDILKLASLGQLDYFVDFPRPFFRFKSSEDVQMKGVEGDFTCRIIYPAGERDRIHAEFEGKLQKLLNPISH
ncbi:MAG: hypothetical protein WCO98_16960 [bacterium]